MASTSGVSTGALLEDEIGFGVESSASIPEARVAEAIKKKKVRSSTKYIIKIGRPYIPESSEIPSPLEAKEWHET